MFACRTLEYTFKIFFVCEIMPSAAAWVSLEIITLSEVSQRKTNIIYDLHVKSKRVVQINLQNRNRVTYAENKLVVTREERWRRDELGDWN